MRNFRIFFAIFAAFTAVANSENKKVVCYFSSWSLYRTGAGRFDVPDINPSLCTHMIYTFVGITENGNVKILDEYRDLPDNYGKDGIGMFNRLRELSPSTKTMVAIGGWNEGSIKFSRVARNATIRTKFVQNAAAFVRKYGFDGFDVDWEYPAQLGGQPADVQNYVLLIKELKQEFNKQGLILSAAVSAIETSASISYNISEISKHLDFINLMSYDFHGSWDRVTGHNAPLYSPKNVTAAQKALNIDAAVKYWLSQGAPPEKLIIALPLYGRTFTLQNSSRNSVGSPASGPGEAGPYTREKGILAYNEICKKLRSGGWTIVRDQEQRVPYAFKDKQWISYDDIISIEDKLSYVKKTGLGGAMLWTIDTEDFRAECGEQYSLLKTVNKILRNGTPAKTEQKLSEQPLSADDDICTEPGYSRDPIDCGRYYLCMEINGVIIPREYNCPAGLYFDLDKKICDYPENVQC